MNTLTLQATFCGLLHGLGKLAFRADKTAADLLAALPDTPEWAAVRGGAAAGSDAARCAAFARSLSVTADTPAAEPASSRCRPLRSIFSHLNGEHPGYSVPAARPDGALHDPVQDAPDIPAAVYRELYQELTGQLTGLQFSPAQANALLGLLESQCSALPASTAREEDRDISLYDQLKLTAALAACVSEYLQQADAFSRWTLPQSCAGNRRSCSTPPTFPASSGSSTPSTPRVLCGPSAAVRSFWNCSWSTTWTSCWTAAA